MTVEEFIAKYRKASIRAEFPDEILQMKLGEALEKGITKVRKLLTNHRFEK